jgi:hypothetical protein
MMLAVQVGGYREGTYESDGCDHATMTFSTLGRVCLHRRSGPSPDGFARPARGAHNVVRLLMMRRYLHCMARRAAHILN